MSQSGPLRLPTTIHLSGDCHGSDGCYLTGEKQRTGAEGWNSGAVALPALAIDSSLAVFYAVLIVALKEDTERILLSIRGRLVIL